VNGPMGPDVGHEPIGELFGAKRCAGGRHRGSRTLEVLHDGSIDELSGARRWSRGLTPGGPEDPETDNRWFVGRLLGALSRAVGACRRVFTGLEASWSSRKVSSETEGESGLLKSSSELGGELGVRGRVQPSALKGAGNAPESLRRWTTGTRFREEGSGSSRSSGDPMLAFLGARASGIHLTKSSKSPGGPKRRTDAPRSVESVPRLDEGRVR